MTIEIDYEAETELPVSYEKIINDIIPAALEYEGCPYETEVNVLITDNEGIRSINRENRGIDAPTDVLSFPMIDFGSPSDFEPVEEDEEEYFDPDTGDLVLGDIVISADKVIEQAEAYGHTPERELAFLLAHSMLHLCGYDHMDDEEREVMEKRQEEILQAAGYPRVKVI